MASVEWFKFLEYPKPLDVPGLADSALISFSLIEPFYSLDRAAEHQVVVGIADKIVHQADMYLAAISNSVTTANDGCQFAQDAIYFCDSITSGQYSGQELQGFLASMITLANRAHTLALQTSEDFRSVRIKLLEICRDLPNELAKVEAEQNTITLPTPVSNDILRKGSLETHIAIASHRPVASKPFKEVVLSQLQQAQNDIAQLVHHVSSFADWWMTMKIGLRALESVIPQMKIDNSNPLRARNVRQRWESVNGDYVLYVQRIAIIQDIYPKLNKKPPVTNIQRVNTPPRDAPKNPSVSPPVSSPPLPTPPSNQSQSDKQPEHIKPTSFENDNIQKEGDRRVVKDQLSDGRGSTTMTSNARPPGPQVARTVPLPSNTPSVVSSQSQTPKENQTSSQRPLNQPTVGAQPNTPPTVLTQSRAQKADQTAPLHSLPPETQPSLTPHPDTPPRIPKQSQAQQADQLSPQRPLPLGTQPSLSSRSDSTPAVPRQSPTQKADQMQSSPTPDTPPKLSQTQETGQLRSELVPPTQSSLPPPPSTPPVDARLSQTQQGDLAYSRYPQLTTARQSSLTLDAPPITSQQSQAQKADQSPKHSRPIPDARSSLPPPQSDSPPVIPKPPQSQKADSTSPQHSQPIPATQPSDPISHRSSTPPMSSRGSVTGKQLSESFIQDKSANVPEVISRQESERSILDSDYSVEELAAVVYGSSSEKRIRGVDGSVRNPCTPVDYTQSDDSSALSGAVKRQRDISPHKYSGEETPKEREFPRGPRTPESKGPSHQVLNNTMIAPGPRTESPAPLKPPSDQPEKVATSDSTTSLSRPGSRSQTGEKTLLPPTQNPLTSTATPSSGSSTIHMVGHASGPQTTPGGLSTISSMSPVSSGSNDARTNSSKTDTHTHIDLSSASHSAKSTSPASMPSWSNVHTTESVTDLHGDNSSGLTHDRYFTQSTSSSTTNNRANPPTTESATDLRGEKPSGPAYDRHSAKSTASASTTLSQSNVQTGSVTDPRGDESSGLTYDRQSTTSASTTRSLSKQSTTESVTTPGVEKPSDRHLSKSTASAPTTINRSNPNTVESGTKSSGDKSSGPAAVPSAEKKPLVEAWRKRQLPIPGLSSKKGSGVSIPHPQSQGSGSKESERKIPVEGGSDSKNTTNHGTVGGSSAQRSSDVLSGQQSVPKPPSGHHKLNLKERMAKPLEALTKALTHESAEATSSSHSKYDDKVVAGGSRNTDPSVQTPSQSYPKHADIINAPTAPSSQQTITQRGKEATMDPRPTASTKPSTTTSSDPPAAPPSRQQITTGDRVTAKDPRPSAYSMSTKTSASDSPLSQQQVTTGDKEDVEPQPSARTTSMKSSVTTYSNSPSSPSSQKQATTGDNEAGKEPRSNTWTTSTKPSSTSHTNATASPSRQQISMGVKVAAEPPPSTRTQPSAKANNNAPHTPISQQQITMGDKKAFKDPRTSVRDTSSMPSATTDNNAPAALSSQQQITTGDKTIAVMDTRTSMRDPSTKPSLTTDNNTPAAPSSQQQATTRDKMAAVKDTRTSVRDVSTKPSSTTDNNAPTAPSTQQRIITGDKAARVKETPASTRTPTTKSSATTDNNAPSAPSTQQQATTGDKAVAVKETPPSTRTPTSKFSVTTDSNTPTLRRGDLQTNKRSDPSPPSATPTSSTPITSSGSNQRESEHDAGLSSRQSTSIDSHDVRRHDRQASLGAQAPGIDQHSSSTPQSRENRSSITSTIASFLNRRKP